MFVLLVAPGMSPAAVTQEKPAEAWWLSAEFPPTESGYDSFKAESIDPDWAKLSILSYKLLPGAAADDLSWMRTDGFVFQVDNFFKRPGIADRELCGVYQDTSGKTGRFLLVLQRKGKSAPWTVAYVHKESGSAGFSVLRRHGGSLYWGTCLQCDEFSRLKLKNGRFDLVGAP
jgi:hypothetical protein